MEVKTVLIWTSILSLITAADQALILVGVDNSGLFLSRFIATSDLDQEYGAPMISRNIPKLLGSMILEKNETS